VKIVTPAREQIEAWVLYDANCGFCTSLARRFAGILARHRFVLLPLQTRWVREQLALDESELLAEMRLLLPDGKTFGGADALVEIGQRFWWARPLAVLGRSTIGMTCLRIVYRWIARNRSCRSNLCSGHNPFYKSHSTENSRHVVFFKMP
jgi:predicted DCC family thiol-disulfide oxidoreductase YuxK